MYFLDLLLSVIYVPAIPTTVINECRMIVLPVCKTESGRGTNDFNTRRMIENISDESIVQT